MLGEAKVTIGDDMIYKKKYVSGAVVNLLQDRRRRDSVFPRCIGSLISVPLSRSFQTELNQVPILHIE